MKIALLSYNNYVNSIAKKAGNNYSNYSTYKVAGPFDINFNPNDGVDTEVTLNISDTLNADYAIVYKDNGVIESRWFVMDAKRNRGGQSFITLHRDVVVDNLDQIKASTALVERATLLDDDPLIFNKENSTYNQIKTSEIQLKDATNTPWIVGYVDRSISIGSYVPNSKVTTSFIDYDYSFESWDDFPLNASTSRVGHLIIQEDHVMKRPRFVIKTFTSKISSPATKYKYTSSQVSAYNSVQTLNVQYLPPSTYIMTQGTGATTEVTELQRLYGNTQVDGRNIYEWLANDLSYPSTENEQEYRSYNNKTIRVKEGSNYRFYKLTLQEDDNIYKASPEYTDPPYYGNKISPDRFPNAAKCVDAVISNSTFLQPSGGDFDGIIYDVIEGTMWYKATAVDSPTGNYSYTSITSTVASLNDAPYRMFAIPYNQVTYSLSTSTTYTSNAVECRKIASVLSTLLGGTGSSFIYDIQLLPYCPIQGLVINNVIDLASLTINKDYTMIYSQSGSNRGFILWPSSSSFTVNLGHRIQTASKKLENETDLFRLCSPNYQGSFEFSVAKNDGVSHFEANCTYRPYSPYIKVAPIFGGLYGSGNSDARGLICGGDFSLPVLDDAWTDYNITNKNFQNIFDRQIESLEYQKNQQLWQNILSAAAGGLSTGVGMGALSGKKGLGLLAGGASFVGGLGDALFSNAIANEQISSQKDIFDYQKGNVQALPQSLSKVGAQTANYRYWPMLEYYTCTQEEKDNLVLSLKVRGMTVGRVDTISNYFDDADRFTYNDKQYIQATMIKSEIQNDNHMAMSVNQELSNGYYFYKE